MLSVSARHLGLQACWLSVLWILASHGGHTAILPTTVPKPFLVCVQGLCGSSMMWSVRSAILTLSHPQMERWGCFKWILFLAYYRIMHFISWFSWIQNLDTILKRKSPYVLFRSFSRCSILQFLSVIHIVLIFKVSTLYCWCMYKQNDSKFGT